MKYLVVFALVALLLAFLYRWLRPYLKRARDLIATIRHVHRTLTSPQKQQNNSPEKLIQCERCGTWIPESRALTARSAAMFCSADCLSGKKQKVQAG